MEAVLRGILIYGVLFIILRISGKRTINTSTPFGLIMVFLLSSCVADAIKDEDHSLTNGILLICTLVSIHYIIGWIKVRSRPSEKVIDDIPTLLVADGKLLETRMKNARISKDDILAAARKEKLKDIDKIKYALLEIDGSLCVIPKEEES